jgi:hypothetical protein
MRTPDPDRPDRSHDARETDRLLEQELRDAVGDEGAERAMERADDVRAAHATPGTPAAREGQGSRQPHDAPGEPPAPRGRATSWITARGPLLAVSFAVVVTIGLIVSLATGSWWALVAALAIHAAGTLVVATTALRLTTETEHVSPALAARLEAEGIADPDRAFTELAAGGAAAGDVVRDGRNERTATTEDDAPLAAREQRTAMTPGSEATASNGGGRTVGLMPPAVVAGSVLVALVAAIVVGGAMWGAAAIAVAAAVGWLLLTRFGTPERRGVLATSLVALVAGVAVFAVLMGVLSDRL